MEYLHNDLGNLSRGDVVEVTLTRAANVRLLDSMNFDKYKKGLNHKLHGGLAKKSPARIIVPSSRRWHVVVDMQGLKGSTKASFKVLKAASLRPLPPLKQPALPSITAGLAMPAGEIVRSSLQSVDRRVVRYDVFISHASEEKDDVVRPLAAALVDRSITVWYDEFTLRIGDSLRAKIDQGVANSHFGIVVLSEAFFGKGWTTYELDGLVSMATSGKSVLLPIWHDLDFEEVQAFSPALAGRKALLTERVSIEDMAEEIAAVIKERLGEAEDLPDEN